MESKLQNITFSKALMIGMVLLGFYWGTFYADGSVEVAKLRGLQNQVKTKKKELADTEKAIKDAARFEVVVQQLGKQMERVIQAIPEKLSTIDLMKLLSTEAKIVGANILAVIEGSGTRGRAKKREEGEFFEEVSVQVNLECTFTQLMMYLSNLTRADKIITLKSLKLQAPKNKEKTGPEGAPMLKINAVISAYRYLGSSGGQ